MTLDAEICHQALNARDARFDGRFFVGIASTGIYCRPICPARHARRENRRFFPSAAAAEAEGFRPCLRCRPELAPGSGVLDAGLRLAHAAVALLADVQFEPVRLPALARRLGITDRHLRRVFRGAFGVAPVVWAQTQRLLLAKRLLTDTRLPVTDVAMASGFGSLRRFNALFRQRYRLNPQALRRALPLPAADEGLKLHLTYRPPLDWPRLRNFLSQRALPGVESWEADRYRRAVSLPAGTGRATGWIEIEPGTAVANSLSVRLSAGLLPVLPQLLARIGHLFDLECHPDEIARRLGALAEHRPGTRLPGAFDGFEIAVRVILGQQVTVRAARTLAGRLVALCGENAATPWPGAWRCFPSAEGIAALPVGALGAIGIVSQRARAIIALAKRVSDGRLLLGPHAPIDDTLQELEAIPGIGPWSAQLIAMRAIGWPDAFPHTDLGVIKALGQPQPASLLALAEGWRPWRAYAVMHLWHRLEEKEQP